MSWGGGCVWGGKTRRRWRCRHVPERLADTDCRLPDLTAAGVGLALSRLVGTTVGGWGGIPSTEVGEAAVEKGPLWGEA